MRSIELGMPVDDRHHIRGVIGLKRGLLHQISQDGFRFGVVFEIDGDSEAFFVGLIADFIDARDRLVVADLVDRLDELGLIDLIRDLGNDDLVEPPSSIVVIVAAARDADFAMPCPIDILQGIRSVDDAAGREIRAGDVLEKIFDLAVRMLNSVDDRLSDLFEVMAESRSRCRRRCLRSR